MDFGYQNGAKLAPKWDQKSMSTSKGDFSKIVLWLQRVQAPGGTPSDGPMGYWGTPLALDFRSLWAHFGTIVGAKFALRNLKNISSNFNVQKVTLLLYAAGAVAGL